VSVVGEKKSDMYGKATKGVAKRETNTLCKGKGIRKKYKKDKGRRSGMCGQAIRSTARIEELGSRIKEKSKETLW